MKILNVKELSKIINVKEKTIYQWVNLGQLPHIKLNGSIRFDFDDIEAWIKNCKKEPYSSYNPLARTARGPGREVKK